MGLSSAVSMPGCRDRGVTRIHLHPRSAVSDGSIRLTLWQVDNDLTVNEFHFRQNVGLHHFALDVATETELNDVPRV